MLAAVPFRSVERGPTCGKSLLLIDFMPFVVVGRVVQVAVCMGGLSVNVDGNGDGTVLSGNAI